MWLAACAVCVCVACMVYRCVAYLLQESGDPVVRSGQKSRGPMALSSSEGGHGSGFWYLTSHGYAGWGYSCLCWLLACISEHSAIMALREVPKKSHGSQTWSWSTESKKAAEERKEILGLRELSLFLERGGQCSGIMILCVIYSDFSHLKYALCLWAIIKINECGVCSAFAVFAAPHCYPHSLYLRYPGPYIWLSHHCQSDIQPSPPPRPQTSQGVILGHFGDKTSLPFLTIQLQNFCHVSKFDG